MATGRMGTPTPMKLPEPRGPVSASVVTALTSDSTVPDIDVPASADVLADDDLQLALWVAYALHYADFEDAPDFPEWEPGLVGLTVRIEEQLESTLRQVTADRIASAREAADDVAEQIFAMAKESDGPSLSVYLHRDASREQYAEFLVHRSLTQLKESDAAAWVLPRIRGGPKAVLAELVYDEYGGGRPDRVHSTLYADALRGAGLDDALGGYVDRLPAAMLAVDNVATHFCINRRLRGAAVGHLAAFEATSSLPARRYAGGAERLEHPPEVAAYYDEHVEADAVHEQLAVRGICGRLVADEPELADDVLLGAAACLEIEERWATEVLEAFTDGRSALRPGTVDRQAIA